MKHKKEVPYIVVVVLNFNGKQHLEYCIPSILKTAYPDFELLIVDNASSDDSLEFLNESYPDLPLLVTEENLGWAGGNNVGIRWAMERDAKYVVLANNDILVHPDWISSAVMAFESHQDAGIVGCHVFGETVPAPVEEFNRAVSDFKSIEIRRSYEYVDGMAMFIRCEVFRAVGLIDEAFFAYCEEVDFQLRAWRAGFENYRTNVPIWHYSSGTFRKHRLKASYLAIRNNIRCSIKNDGLINIVKTILIQYWIGCSPFFRGNRKDVTVARIRSRNIFFNFGLITYSLLWNFLFLPFTIYSKIQDRNKISKYLSTKSG